MLPPAKGGLSQLPHIFSIISQVLEIRERYYSENNACPLMDLNVQLLFESAKLIF